MRETLGEVYTLLFGASLALSPAYLLPAVLVAWVVYRRQGLRGGGAGAGWCQGVLLGTLGPGTEIATIAGINAFFVAANAALAALHHSHVWLRSGPVLEHIVISPAQHQIHHSQDPRHHDRNFGNSLALWDWMFGTPYVIRGSEELSFGLSGRTEQPLMSQELSQVLWDPLRRMLRLR